MEVEGGGDEDEGDVEDLCGETGGIGLAMVNFGGERTDP